MRRRGRRPRRGRGPRSACPARLTDRRHVQVAREARLPAGTRLYRGLGGERALPAFFYRGDARGRRGALEWGFMSTTMRQ